MRLALPVVILVAAAAGSCSRTPSAPVAEAKADPAPAPRQTRYGKVTAGPVLRPSEILARLDAYDGKLVRVEGTVAAVCPHRGCWMDVAGADGGRIRIKVTDGEIVFPVSAQGKHVIAEGKVVKIPVDPAADRAACGGEGEAHAQAPGEHEECARPSGAEARIEGSGATIFEAS